MRNIIIIGASLVLLIFGLSQTLLNDDTTADPQVSGQAQTEGQVAANQQAAANADTVPANLYQIDPAQSELYWRVYRDGPMARFGHNHVISLEDYTGSITLADDIAQSSWEISFQVDALIIDDPELRARYGEDFESVPSEDDKAGTKENMLTEGVLDGINFPAIQLTGSGFSGSMDAASLPVSIEMLGRTIERTFTATIEQDEEGITVSGEHRLSHTDLGLVPFSVFGGAMAVGEDIDITFRLRAVSPTN